MRLFIDPGGYGTHNHGDTAMLVVALNRLSAGLPGAEFTLVNKDPEYFRKPYPQVTCISPLDRRMFFRGLVPKRLVRKVGPWVLERESRVAVRFPRLWTSALASRNRLSGPSAGDARRYLTELLRSQVLVVTGTGKLNDAFQEDALAVFDEMEIAVRSGIPVYLFGQGIGPIDDRALRRRAQQMLPRATGICLREARAVPLLEQMGVPAARIVVTGDDAIELAFLRKPASLGSGLGFNLRVASYSNLNSDLARSLGQAIRRSAAELGADLHPVPISRHEGEDDLDWGCRMVTGAAPPPDLENRFRTPEDTIAEAGKCRTVVTASYHGAVFALAQGVSVVALSRSPYYDSKFLGLAEQFGPAGCEVVRIGDDFTPDSLTGRIGTVWTRAGQVRPALLRAAEQQVALSQAAYRHMSAEVARTA